MKESLPLLPRTGEVPGFFCFNSIFSTYFESKTFLLSLPPSGTSVLTLIFSVIFVLAPYGTPTVLHHPSGTHRPRLHNSHLGCFFLSPLALLVKFLPRPLCLFRPLCAFPPRNLRFCLPLSAPRALLLPLLRCPSQISSSSISMISSSTCMIG